VGFEESRPDPRGYSKNKWRIVIKGEQLTQGYMEMAVKTVCLNGVFYLTHSISIGARTSPTDFVVWDLFQLECLQINCKRKQQRGN